MQLTADATYELRLKNGTYDAITDALIALGPAALANVNYGVDFVSSDVGADENSYDYVDVADNTPFSTLLFGEVAHSIEGTRLSAAGNHYAGPEHNPVKDSSNVKDVLVLSPPSLAPEMLLTFYNNQVATLSDLRIAEEKMEAECNKIPTSVKECIRSPAANPTGPMNHMIVTLPRKYAVPPVTNTSSIGTRITKKRVSAESDIDTLRSDSPDNTLDDSQPSGSTDNNGTHIIDGHEIKIDAYYPLEMLPDHRGPYFQQKKSKLVQLDIRDINDELIPPWHLYEKLRPGTLVLIQASLICWIMKETNSNEFKKIYQLLGHSVKTLAESAEPVEERTPPSFAGTSKPASAASKLTARPSATKAASMAFTNFGSPSKKKRTN